MCKLVASTFRCFLFLFRLFSLFTCVHFVFLFKHPLFHYSRYRRGRRIIRCFRPFRFSRVSISLFFSNIPFSLDNNNNKKTETWKCFWIRKEITYPSILGRSRRKVSLRRRARPWLLIGPASDVRKHSRTLRHSPYIFRSTKRSLG